MKKGLNSILVVVCMVFCLVGCSKDHSMLTREVSIPENTPLKGVIVEGPWHVTLLQSDDDNEATITYCAHHADKITTTVTNGYVYLRIKHDWKNFRKEDLSAKIVVAGLETLKASGAAEIITIGEFFGENIDIDLSGASSASGLRCTGNILNMELHGASDVKDIAFSGKTFKAELSGASSIKRGDCRVEGLTLKASGASDVNLSGEAIYTTVEGSGASGFDILNVETTTMNVYLSGASDARVNVTERITGHITGASRLKYRRGVGSIEVTTEGSSKIEAI